MRRLAAPSGWEGTARGSAGPVRHPGLYLQKFFLFKILSNPPLRPWLCVRTPRREAQRCAGPRSPLRPRCPPSGRGARAQGRPARPRRAPGCSGEDCQPGSAHRLFHSASLPTCCIPSREVIPQRGGLRLCPLTLTSAKSVSVLWGTSPRRHPFATTLDPRDQLNPGGTSFP